MPLLGMPIQNEFWKDNFMKSDLSVNATAD